MQNKGNVCVGVCAYVCVCVILYTKTGVARNAVVTPLCKAVWYEQREHNTQIWKIMHCRLQSKIWLWWRHKIDKLKETKTHISSLLLYKVFIIENNQWKFEQNQAKNKEVTALWNLAISRGRYSKWWQVVVNSPYVLYMKFHVFPLFWWLRQFPSLKSRYDKQGCILHIMKSSHENTRIERKLKKNEILCTKWMESCPQLSP